MTDGGVRRISDCWFHGRSEEFDPTDPTIAAHFPPEALARAADWSHGQSRRGRTEWRADSLLALFLVPIMPSDGTDMWNRRVFLLASHDAVLTLDGTGQDHEPVDPGIVLAPLLSSEDRRPGRVAFLVLNAVAAAFTAFVDRFDARAEAIEQRLDDSASMSRRRGNEIREDLKDLRVQLHDVRRSLLPTIEAVRQIVSGADLKGQELFPDDVERRLRDTLDTLIYASESLDATRDEITGLRDYLQSCIANDQNEVMKALTIVASLVLIPTFIVGFYGQNFDVLPGRHGGFWIACAAMVVVVLLELAYLRRKGWIGGDPGTGSSRSDPDDRDRSAAGDP